MSEISAPYTIRYKSSRSPVITFRPKFFAKLLEAEPAASNLALAWLVKRLKDYGGKSYRFDHEQEMALLQRYGAASDGTWKDRFSDVEGFERYVLIRSFRDGFLTQTTGMDVEKALSIASLFFKAAEVWFPP